MREKTIPIIALAIIMFFGACSNEELLSDTKQENGRTLSLTASMPGDDAATRVGLTKETDKSISLTWEVGDKLQLAFVQEAIKVKSTITLTAENITNEGKRAQFNIILPDEIVDGTLFDLYGVYGGGGRTMDLEIGLPGGGESGNVNMKPNYSGDALELGDENTNPYVKLPKNTGNATSLEEVQRRKDVMLYFESKGINVNKPQISVMFQHLGSLFSFTFQNNGSTDINDIKEVRLSSDDTNDKWAYNTEAGGQVYDLLDGFQNKVDGSGYYIYFNAENMNFPVGSPITLWAWYPPLPETNWPALKVEVVKTDNSIVTSVNKKPARTAPTAAGKTYYFYTEWSGSELIFTAPPLEEDEYYVAEMGTLNTVLGDQKATIERMILKGQINAADFEVMKMQMPALTYLDLSKVNCEDNKIPYEALDGNGIITTIILPESITAIENRAFHNCTGLNGSLTIPNGVTAIGNKAFLYCSGLTGSLNLPKGLITIGEAAFNSCSGLTGSLTIPNNVTTINKEAFAQCSGLTGSLTLPAGLMTIGTKAFTNCGFTGPLAISNNVTSIGEGAFMWCQGFTGSLTIPNSMTEIGSDAFYNCTGFTGSLTLPAGLITISEYAFQSCTNISGAIHFPISLSTMGEGAFDGCTSVEVFQFLSSTPITYALQMLPIEKPVTVPLGTVAAYETTWGANASRHAITATL